MPIAKSTLKKAHDFIEVLKIGKSITEQAVSIDPKTKFYLLKEADYNLNMVEEAIGKGELGSAGLKSLIDSYFVYWNESVEVATEEFWAVLKERSFEYKRKDPLRFVLNKGRFRNVHNGMAARKSWKDLIENGHFLSRYTTEEVKQLNEAVENDEKQRISLLSKCLAKKKIPPTQYLRFSDSMGYVDFCELIDTHFSDKEWNDLHKIWKDFEG